MNEDTIVTAHSVEGKPADFDENGKLKVTTEVDNCDMPCPFCGSEHTEIHSEELEAKTFVTHVEFVQCVECHARGPVSLVGKKTKELWNSRVSSNEPF